LVDEEIDANPEVGKGRVEVMVDRVEAAEVEGKEVTKAELVGVVELAGVEPPVAIAASVTLKVPVPPTKSNLAENA